MDLVIKLSTSESLVFFGCFGLVFALPNFYQIFLKEIFPIIIETSTSYTTLFKILYVVLLLFISYETYHWIIDIIKIMKKTKNIHNNYGLYVLNVVIFGVLGFLVASILNLWLF